MTSDKITLSGNFQKRPFWFSIINSSWQATYFLGSKIKLDKDEMIRSARRITGLDDLGKDFSDEPLERLLWSVNEEANLHAVGRFITRQRFISLLSIRLRAEYFFRRHPEILDQPLYPAWIIIGLQRTGTTKLQRLLAADPDHRVIPSWEVINPLPLSLDEKVKDKRMAVARTSVRALKLLSPGFFAIHPIEINEPEEDILLLDVSFLSTTPEAMMNVPSYADWLEKTDQSSAYAYAVKLLKFLQWAKPAKRWVLKTPHHLEFPDLIEKHFGEVHFLWPHRLIYESVPSFLSMVTYNQMIFSDYVDEKKIAAHWVRKTGYMLDKALDYRAKPGNSDKFTDIYYNDLIRNSEEELRRIYSMNGGLKQDLMARFEKHEEENPHRKYGTHQYSLADFGLTESDIDKHTFRYRQFITERYGR
ncbi:MAG: sulfotransferase [Bacteroidetes bacterium]|nr:sulfotransferase [Bacteroidota bacterium]